jgi:hypothetical protein
VKRKKTVKKARKPAVKKARKPAASKAKPAKKKAAKKKVAKKAVKKKVVKKAVKKAAPKKAAPKPSARPSALTPISAPPRIKAWHVVRASDTPSTITEKYFGTSDQAKWMAVYDVNKSVIGPDPNQLRPGLLLRIPDV